VDEMIIRDLDLTFGDEGDPDWDEAVRFASGLLAARLRLEAGDREAIAPALRDLVVWAVDEKPVKVAVNRLLSVIEALVRYAECGICVTAAGLDDPTSFAQGPHISPDVAFTA
jgi:hypothetical protein